MKKETINDLIYIRDYFGKKDKTIFEHCAYKIMDDLIEELKAVDDRFSTKEKTLLWLSRYIPFAVKPLKKSKTMLVDPFKTNHACNSVIESLAESIFDKTKT